jgi:RHS repeat-associated protein
VEDASGTNGFNNGVNTTNEYFFDGNGNLTADLNKGYTSILYNYLNLPKRVGTATAGQYISYIYDAGGSKLAKIGTTGTYTYYAGGFVYNGSSLSYIIHEEGYIEPSGAYKYYLKDHLGSVRLVVNTTGTGGTIERQTDYYPFGMTIAEYNASVVDYGYNGKELQDDLINSKKLDWYDYGARFYDPQLGRWNVIDPMIEKHFDYSGYAYSYNNPVRFMDLMGLDTLDINYNDDGIWEITNTQMVRGDDIFRVTKDGKTTTHTFSEGEYGERVNMLNLETNDDYTLGIYHVSGAEYANGRNGYYVTPGGDASTEVGSNARLPEDTYDLQASPEAASWRQIWVTNGEANGDVSARGIKFHFGGSSPADWTKGCFVLSSAYTKNGNNIQYNFSESRTATIWMDFHLGATSVYRYATEKYNGSGRIGAQFSGTNLIHKLILKDGF